VGAHATRGQQLAWWRLVATGRSMEEAAVACGVPLSTARFWFKKSGGVIPRCARPSASQASQREPSYRRLSIEEREFILEGMSQRRSIRAMARDLGREPSTISREIRKNIISQRYGIPGKRGPKVTAPWRYSPHHAQQRADRRARERARPGKLAANLRLRVEVQDRLKTNHSPEQISARLAVDFPDDAEMRVSHETIYQALYVQGKGGLNRELTRHLRTGRSLRKPHRQPEQRRSRIKNMVMISERPPEVEDRAVPGHWEGDLILGSVTSASAIGTLVERATGFTMLLHLPGNHGALAVQQAMTEAMALLPETLRRTLTWDQGIEMANHAKIAAATGLDIYFCDPHSPWQRGSNENTNGLLRQYFPKGTDLSLHGAGYLEFVAAELNNRPRKRLDWATPAEALAKLLFEPSATGVALEA
jgi:IS30 family transposase